jgi:bifunctional ADP-heptose synthase (sugar kinase/adenylyltransferase)
VIGEEHRLELVGALRCVDAAVLNDGPGADVVRAVRPDFLVVGSDWRDRDYLAQIAMTADELADLGVSLRFVSYTAGVSTTELRERIAA